MPCARAPKPYQCDRRPGILPIKPLLERSTVSNFDPNAPGGPPPGWTPPPGGQPPPWTPPPGGQQLPPYGAAQGNYMPPPNVPGPLAEWPQRALGILIDLAIILGPQRYRLYHRRRYRRGIGVLLILVAWLYGLVGWIFFAYPGRQHSGVTPGMRIVGLKCVGIQTGQPIGARHGRRACHRPLLSDCVLSAMWLPFPALGHSKADACRQDNEDRRDRRPQAAFSITPPT